MVTAGRETIKNSMKQEYIIGDIVMYHNKIMVIKEPRDGIHFDLSCPEEKLVYCCVGVEDIKPMPLTSEILEKNGWKWDGQDFVGACLIYPEGNYFVFDAFRTKIKYVHQLQHLLFGLGIDFDFNLGNSKKGDDE